MVIYVVQQGDTLNSIAELYSVETSEIIEDNQLLFPYNLVKGQALLINNGLGERNMVLRSSGYAYPFILPEVLNNTLPYLSSIHIFSI